MLELFGIGILIVLIGAVIYLSKGAGYKDAENKFLEAEIETIQENIKATTIKEHELATASNDERAKLRKKWTRKS